MRLAQVLGRRFVEREEAVNGLHGKEGSSDVGKCGRTSAKKAEFVLVERSEISAMGSDMDELQRRRIVPSSGVGSSGAGCGRTVQRPIPLHRRLVIMRASKT